MGHLENAKIIYSVKDADDPKDKATVIIEQEAVVDDEDGQAYDSIKCSCRFNI